MKKPVLIAVAALAGMLGACSQAGPQTPDVAGNIRKSLEQAGLKDVTVTQDRDKGVVTLGGHVAVDGDKARAESLAKAMAANQVVADEIAILPANDAGASKTMYADLDKGIDSNLDAALIAGGFRTGIRHSVKNGVVTLKGSIETEDQRSQVEHIAQGVPNVQQVVNEIQTTHQRATSSR